MNRSKQTTGAGAGRPGLCFLLLAVLLAGLIIWHINAGSVPLSVGELARILLGRNADNTAYNIIWQIRLPRILSAIILGVPSQYPVFFCRPFSIIPSRAPSCWASPPALS